MFLGTPRLFSSYGVLYGFMFVCIIMYIYWDCVMQPLRGYLWFLGYGLANCTTEDRWAGAPF